MSILVKLTRSGALSWEAFDGEGSKDTKWRTAAEDGYQLERLRTGNLSFSGTKGESTSEYIAKGRVSTCRLVRAIDTVRRAEDKVRQVEHKEARERSLMSLQECLQRSMK